MFGAPVRKTGSVEAACDISENGAAGKTANNIQYHKWRDITYWCKQIWRCGGLCEGCLWGCTTANCCWREHVHQRFTSKISSPAFERTPFQYSWWTAVHHQTLNNWYPGPIKKSRRLQKKLIETPHEFQWKQLANSTFVLASTFNKRRGERLPGWASAPT